MSGSASLILASLFMQATPCSAQEKPAETKKDRPAPPSSARDPSVSVSGGTRGTTDGRTNENAVASAEDAFGNTIGREALGLYGPGSVRGFSPTVAGNVRIEGIYFDQQGGLTGRIQSGSIIRVGVAAQSDPFPAPTGLVDISLRRSDTPGTSVLALVGPYGGVGAEFDSRLQLGSGNFSASVGAGAYSNEFASGGSGKATALGIVSRLKLFGSADLTGFWGRSDTYDETPAPIYIPRDATLPPRIGRGSFDGPDWALRNGPTVNLGLIGKTRISSWRIEAGGFRSVSQPRTSFANLVTDITSDGSAQRLVFANPSSRFASTSGELRVSRTFTDGPRQHLILVSLRGRSVRSRFGGSDLVDLGRAPVGAGVFPPQPDFQFSEQTFDTVNQKSAGISYGLRWADRFAIRAGVQLVNYQKAIASPGVDELRLKSTDLLPNVTASVELTPRLLVYGSYTRGLEQNGQAPDFADNRLTLLPALITSQYDFGVRWALPGGTNLVAGYFHVQKPYFNLDQDNTFRQLGNEVHSGIELSATTVPTKGLRLVAGAVIQSPKVSASEIFQEVGRRPVGQPTTIVQVNANYELQNATGFSIDSSVNYTGPQKGDVLNRVDISAFLTVSIGARYRFQLRSIPVTLRASITNLTNSFRWLPIGSGAYEPLNQRSVRAYLTADF